MSVVSINDPSPANWAVQARNYLDDLDSKIEENFPINILQTKIDELSCQIKEQFSIFEGFNSWLEENNATEWYTQLATYLVKLPPKAAWNVINGLSLVISRALYMAVHPVKGLNALAKDIVSLLNEITKSENWPKMGAGSLGALTAQGMIFGNPVSLLGLAIGGALIAGGFYQDTVATLLSDDPEQQNHFFEKIKMHAKQLPEAFVTGLFTSLLIGGIKRAFSSEGEMRIPEKDLMRPAIFEKVPDVAQYGGADWNNLVKIENGLTLDQAKQIAANSSEIDFFFYMKEGMILGGNASRSFAPGDAAFFSGEPWWGSAPGMADGFIKG